MLHVLGNACRDIRFRVEILPRPGETLNARITYGGLGGKGLNQAIAAARAEMDVRLIAAVGNDSAASLIRDTLRAERIAADTHIDLPGEPDYSVTIVARGGENMIITSASQAESVTGRDVDRRVSISSGDALLLQRNLCRSDPSCREARETSWRKSHLQCGPIPGLVQDDESRCRCQRPQP
jgi:ribokinase